MISSRCNEAIPIGNGGEQKLTDLREAIKRRLEAERLCGEQIYRVSITPEHPVGGADETFWESSLRAVRESDIVLVLSNGDAGYPHPRADLGICEAEFDAAISSGAERTYVILLPEKPRSKVTQAQRKLNQGFTALIKQFAPSGTSAANAEDALNKGLEAVLRATISLAMKGGEQARAGKADFGPSLSWSQLNFTDRKRNMEEVLAKTLISGERRAGAKEDEQAGVARFAGQSVLVVCHAIPAAFSVAGARELVGRPFLLDHLRVAGLRDCAGPVHFIACQKTTTERQATDLLGFPDATVVRSSFGVYVADPVQKVQVVLLARCHNPIHTRDAIARFSDWLSRTGLEQSFVSTARARAKIVRVIADQQVSNGR